MHSYKERINALKKVLCYYYGVEWNKLQSQMKKSENRYIMLLLLKEYNLIELDKAKSEMGLSTIKNIKYGIRKAEEKFLVNKYFRDRYILIEDEVRKVINNG